MMEADSENADDQEETGLARKGQEERAGNLLSPALSSTSVWRRGREWGGSHS